MKRARDLPLVLLGGAPGVGKSTVLALLRDGLHGGACVEVDALWSMLGGPSCVGADYVTALDLAVSVSTVLLAAGRGPVLVASPWSPDGAAAFHERLGAGRARQLSLVAEATVLTRRLAGRPSWAFNRLDEALKLNALLIERGGDVIDTTELAPAEVAARVAAYVAGP